MRNVERHFQRVLGEGAGAKYYKVDLHIHTPSSSDQKYKFSQKDAREDIEEDVENKKKPYERAREIAREILHELVAKGISVAAFTDHNSPGYVDNGNLSSLCWYQLLKQEYKKLRAKDGSKDCPKLLLLPGVEITTDRIHILGIFDDEDEFATFKIASLLRSIDIRESEFGKVNGVFGTKSIWEVADAIDELGGICIPAHINRDNMRSLLGQYQPPDMEIERLVQHRAIHVFGVVPPNTRSWKEQRSYRSILENKTFKNSSGVNVSYHDWMVEKREEVPQHLPTLGYMMNSDAHSVDKIGERFSWIKLDDLSFRSLASALRNPAYCVHDNRVQPTSSVRSHVFGVSVEGGFANRLCMRFNEHFNCIVAGPNTGKTTLMRVVQDTLEGKRLGLRIRDGLKGAINDIADGLWDEIKDKGEVFTKKEGLPRKDLPEEVRLGIGTGFLETRDLPWRIFVFLSQVQEDGNKVIYAVERRRRKGIEDLDGKEDQFRYYKSGSLSADLDSTKEVNFSEIKESVFRRKMVRSNFYFDRIELGDETCSFPGARYLLDRCLLRVMPDYERNRRNLFKLCRQLEEAVEGDSPEKAIADDAKEVRRLLKDLYALRKKFAAQFNRTEGKKALQIAFHKGSWQEMVATIPESHEVPDYVHQIRQYLFGREYYDPLELTFYQKKKRSSALEKVHISQLSPESRRLMALRLLLNSTSDMAPVFIDCPEQWLNNETLIEFCDMRCDRDDQLIWFTQNPNIAILGNAEQTIILGRDGNRTKVVASGGLGQKDVAEGVINLLEGGSKAFQRKLLRYQTDLRRSGLRVELQRLEKV